MKRNLSHHTWKEVLALNKDPGTVVLPIGAIEQHGPHLPLCTDATLASSIVERALERLPDTIAAWYLPVVPYGKSTEHLGYVGTISLSASTLVAVVGDIARSLRSAGFRRLLIFNGHGGNLALLQMVARDLRAETGMLCAVAMPEMAQAMHEFPEPERHFGIHAGTLETGWMLALTPELVHPERAKPHYPAFPDSQFKLTALPQVAWLTRDWSPDGHFGDPTVATQANGKRWLESAVQALAQWVEEFSNFEVAHP